jgi:tetratricopeptide (TPR) repeat protein
MNLFAQSALFLWLPTVVVIFACLPPRRAVIVSYVFAWLALPNVAFNVPGLPDFTKMSATVVAVLLSILLFDTARFFSFRFRWYDVPTVIWCFCPFVTAISNEDQGVYEGISSLLTQTIWWGLPYFIGRLYLTDLDAIRELCVVIVIGALVYVPLCWIELRLSPVLEKWVYGMGGWYEERYGGYRPKVFLQTGLEVGLWMTTAALVAYQLWWAGTVKQLRGFKFSWLMIILVITSILCKSTGAIAQMSMGFGVLWMVRLTKRSWPVLFLLAIPIFYCSTRSINIWDGMDVVNIARATVGNDRAVSFEYRIRMENMLTERALERPIFGWGRFKGSNIYDKDGRKLSVQDGYWIIAMGVFGFVGLISLVIMMLLPMILTIRRFPVKTWFDPQVTPVVAMSMFLVLTMIDFLSNAMLNPIYAVAIGGLVGQSAVKLSGGIERSVQGLKLASDLMSEGRVNEAAREFNRTIHLVDDGDDVHGREIHANALDGLGQSMLALGKPEDAEHAFRDGLLVRDWLAAKSPDAGRFRDLAIAREGLARLLAETGRVLEAVEERQIALKIWDILASEHPRNTDYRHHRVTALNDLAWMLVTDPDPRVFDPSQALMLAEEAVRSATDNDASWNTLGVARYRTGDWAGAIEALERSALSSLNGQGTAFDHYFLSMSWSRLQHEGQAREWIERGVAWTARHRPGHPLLEQFRQEAEALWSSETGTSTGTNSIVKL